MFVVQANLEQVGKIGQGTFGIVFEGKCTYVNQKYRPCPSEHNSLFTTHCLTNTYCTTRCYVLCGILLLLLTNPGIASGIKPGEATTRVAVKMLSEEKEDITNAFMAEAAIMQAIDGPHNIVRLLGLVTTEAPFLMIMELMENGDLKSVLRDERPRFVCRNQG